MEERWGLELRREMAVVIALEMRAFLI